MKRSQMIEIIAKTLEEKTLFDFDPWEVAEEVFRKIEKVMVPNYIPGWDKE